MQRYTEADLGKEVKIGSKTYIVVAGLADDDYKLAPVAKSQSYKSQKARRLAARLAEETREIEAHAAQREAIRFERENPRAVVPAEQLMITRFVEA